ncbi:putative integral membrane protein (TIGR00697 family) [Leucobacter exalbidus]|uniref:Probable queuosine precursor transporter n=1 Tax=Leucobacter exalbidus TaxID=662960 RepID=A0A940PWQ3_9MICO|nr:queuosine precursor transporter [Leucobacter exalbidus]MBP1325586.1 putative integral membrane protein (TIGR00697 family) [Leucobacter exalbidus]
MSNTTERTMAQPAESSTPEDYQTPGARAARNGSRYAMISAMFVGILLISNVVAVKPIAFGAITLGDLSLPLVFDGGVFLFPLAYVLGDVLAEVYGLKASRRAIFSAFGLALVASLTIFVVQISPAAEGWNNQEAYAAVLGFVPRIVAASLIAFLAGQLVNAWVLDRLRQRTSGRFLRTRLIGSTIVGQLIDTLLFCTIAFAGIITGIDFVMYVVLGYVVKVLAEVVLLPITTRVITAVRTAEQRSLAA